MSNLMIPIPDRKTACPKGVAFARHPSNQRLYRQIQIQPGRLVNIFAPHIHAERITAQGPTPSGIWYWASLAVIDGLPDGAETGVEVG